MPASRWVGHKLAIPPALPDGCEDHVVAKPLGVELGVRIWPPTKPSSRPAPWVLWFHGGSTVMGTPYCIPPWVIPEFTSRGYYVLSAGYRLCPHASLEDSLQDCLNAYAWGRENLNKIFGEKAVNVDRCAVGGESAGARLSTLIALRASPPPKVVLDVYGHTTYYDKHVLEPLAPGTFEWPSSLPPLDRVIEEVECHDPSRAIVHTPYFPQTEEEIRRAWSFPTFVQSERVDMQGAIVKYYALSQSKNYHALRLNEHPDPGSRAAQIQKYSLLHLLNTVDTYPATVILQGLGDTIVDPKMSTDLAAKLKSMDVPVLDLYEDGAPHGFDFIFTSPDVEDYDKFITATLEFVDKHI